MELPEGWKLVKLGGNQYFKVETGGTPKTDIREYWENGYIKRITPKDLGKLNSMYINNTERKITTDGLNNSSTKLVPNGSIVLSTRAPIGHLAILNDDMCFNQGCKSIIIKSHDVLNKYVYYYLRISNKELNKLGNGATFKELSKTSLENFLIPIPYKDNKPDLQKQKEIVNKIETLFNNINKAIELRQKAINETKDLFNSVLNKVFKEVAEEEGELIKLKEIIKTEKGKKPKKLINESNNKALPYLTVDYYRSGVLKQYSEENEKMRIVKPNDLVLIWDGSKSGEIFISDIEGILSSTMVKINIKDVNFNNKYIYWVIKYYFPILNNNTTGSGIPHVSKEVFNNLLVPTPYKDNAPDLQKQKEIAEYLDNLHNKIKRLEELQEKQLNLFKELKESILNKAFKGELV